jgi:hypothetical protein
VSATEAAGKARRLIEYKPGHPVVSLRGAEIMVIQHYPDLGPLQGVGAPLRF